MISKSVYYCAFISILALTSGCFHKRKLPDRKISNVLATNQSKKPVTIFVHGTLPPVLNHFCHTFDIPLGLTPASNLKRKYVQARIPFFLNKADAQQFPLNSFYVYGWSGGLNYKARKHAAEKLYLNLKQSKAPLTLIGHSHGCNVILLLAELAKEHNDNHLTIERVILLAPPVQQITAHYVKHSIFKRVYSFYSAGDLLQVLDPQGLQAHHIKMRSYNSATSLFSHRLFPSSPNLTQIRVLFDNKYDPWHLSFIFPKFLMNMPAILNDLDSRITNNTNDHFLCSIRKIKSKLNLLHDFKKHAHR